MRARKLLVRLRLGLVLLVSGCAALTIVRVDRTFEAPLPDLHASADPAVIERGRYLVTGATYCAVCHAMPEQQAAALEGELVPLAGGRTFRLPVGEFRAPNITNDKTTGIGRYSDPEVARALRYGVHANGKAVLPFMPYSGLADDDLTAIISYLRAQPAVAHEVPGHRPNAMGKIVLAWVIEPRGPEETPPKTKKPETTAIYGEYLATNVGNCIGCHTKINLRTGAFTGPKFGGGAIHTSTKDPRTKFVSPNLTPDPTWGWINDWSEDVFVARMHAGPIHDGSPMPWQSFKNVSDDDLRALYRFFRSLPPMTGGPDPAHREAAVIRSAP